MTNPQQETISAMLQRRLATDFKGKQKLISSETGVAQNTISRIKRGEGSPTLGNVEKLLDWMAKQDAKTQKKTARKAS